MSTAATILLQRLGAGEPGAADELLALVYEDLRALAGSYFRNQPADHTLQPTALAHEAFIRLIDRDSPSWNNRAHFMAVAATAMRQILTDFSRRRKAAKRGGGAERVTLAGIEAQGSESELDVVELDDLLGRLSQQDARKARVVELRFFGGLEAAEAAEVLGVSLSTVEADWRAARAWLLAQLTGAKRSG